MKKINKKKIKKYSLSLRLTNIDWKKVEAIFSAEKINWEKRWRNNKRENPGVRDLLKLLAGGTVVGLSFIMPALPMAIAPFILDSNKYNKWSINRTVERLKKQKLVKVVEENGQTVVRITEDGRIRALRYKLEEMTVKEPKRWDKKWRLVIFDIPEKYKRIREIFRHHLKVMGFYPLQKSVWIHAYPCFNEIEFLREIYHVGINVTYIIAEQIESTDDVKSYFSLE